MLDVVDEGKDGDAAGDFGVATVWVCVERVRPGRRSGRGDHFQRRAGSILNAPGRAGEGEASESGVSRLSFHLSRVHRVIEHHVAARDAHIY